MDCRRLMQQRSEKPFTLISHRTVAERAGTCVRTVTRLAERDPKFPTAVRIGHRKFYSESAVDAYLRDLIRAATTPLAGAR
jgi:predicted DNA-binding transcriptional regulator AlpA